MDLFIQSEKELFYELQHIFDLFSHDAMKALIVAKHTIKLHEAVGNENFEEAAILRDKIKGYKQTLDEELSNVYI